MMTDTKVPISKKNEKTKRVMVELLEDGQQPHKRHGAEPHRHEACQGWTGEANTEDVRKKTERKKIKALGKIRLKS